MLALLGAFKVTLTLLWLSEARFVSQHASFFLSFIVLMLLRFDSYLRHAFSTQLNFKYFITPPCFSRPERVMFKSFAMVYETPRLTKGARIQRFTRLPPQATLWAVYRRLSTFVHPFQIFCTTSVCIVCPVCLWCTVSKTVSPQPCNVFYGWRTAWNSAKQQRRRTYRRRKGWREWRKKI